MKVTWSGVSVYEDTAENTDANAFFNNHTDYDGYEFHCYTIVINSPATSYVTNPLKYMYMTQNGRMLR